MKFARLRLVVAALLFAGWIGWLAYLALTSSRPRLLSRPQFLVSQLDVVAVLKAGDHGPSPDVQVEEIYWSSLPPQELRSTRVSNLSRLTAEDGWEGPGRYLLPLVKEHDHYRVASIPPSPGLDPRHERPRIYLVRPEMLEQLRVIRGDR